MQRIPYRYLNYLLAAVLAFVALSTGLNVRSDSSLLVSSPDAARVRPAAPEALSPAAGQSALTNGGLGVARRPASDPLAAMMRKAAAASPFGPVLTATKTASPNTSVNPGDTIMYTVEITNTGNADATGVNFSDTIDPNTTLVPGSVTASPIAVDDSYHTIGNVHIQVPVAQGVIANDLNPNPSGTLTVTKVNATAVPGGGSATASTANGSVTMSSDGSFTYSPNANFRGPTDSFTYTLDNGTGKIDTATVSIAVNGLIWFVDAGAPAAGADGTLAHPFSCLVGSGCFNPAASDAANDNIFLYSGSYTGGLSLLAGQYLIGQGASQSLLTITGLAAPSGTNLLPATGGTNPAITTSAASTNGVNLGTNNQIWGVTFGNTTGAGVSGTGFGTLKVRDTAKNGSGQALNLSTGTLDAIFQSIASTSSAGTGISVNAASGSLSVSGATSITNSAGTGVSLTNNTGTISFAALNISNAGTNQSGLVGTDNSNTITTAGGAISTGSGTAVNITRASGTTPLNVTLTSVSANGGANGIVLSNTSGSFTVAGDGTNTANGSGGTIQNHTGADNAIAGRGVSLSNVTNFTLSQVNLHDFSNYAIFGSGVTGFTLSNCIISGVNGNNDAVDEDSVRLLNLLGSALIDRCTISGGFEDNLAVRNTTGTLNRLTVSNTTIGLNSTTKGDNGIYFEANSGGATAKLTVDSCTFTGSRGDQIDVIAQSGTTASATLTNNNLKNTHTNSLSGGVIVHGAGTVTFNISGNTFGDGTATHSAKTSVINISKSATTGTYNGTISNNTIGTAGVVKSGCSAGSGIFVDGGGTSGSSAVAITNNQIHGYSDTGIYLLANGQGGVVTGNTFNATVTGNVTDTPDPGNGFAGIFTDIGAFPTDTNAVCLDIGGAGALANNFSTGDPFDFADINMSEIGNVTIRLPGYVGGATDTTAIENYLKGRNLNPGTTAVFISPDVNGYTGGAACGAPNMSGLSLSPIETASARRADGESTLGDDDDSILRAVRGEASNIDGVQPLRSEELAWLAQAAIQRWKEAGIADEDLARLQAVTFELADLPAGQIASVKGNFIRVDETGAGYGWFLDNTPEGDYEYDVLVIGKELQTTELSPANGRMDLLTVLVRELGAVYLQGRNKTPKKLRPLMEPTLSPSVRRVPVFHFTDPATVSVGVSSTPNGSVMANAGAQPKANAASASPAHAVFTFSGDNATEFYSRSAKRMSYVATARRVAYNAAPYSGETVSLNIGTIPPGEKVVIMFSVTVNNPAGACSVTNQGHVTASNASPVDTNSVSNVVNKSVTISACPANITKSTDAGQCSAVVSFTTPTGDGCPAPTVTCNPASGTTFNKGVTTVTCTASNGVSPDASCTFTVTVNDNEAPHVVCPANITQSTDANVCTAVVTYATATATDNCPGVGAVTCTPASGTAFPKGINTVTCSVTDASSNAGSCTFTVTVNDTQSPTITCPASIVHDTDPNACTAVVTYASPTVSDNCPGVGSPTCSPASGTAFPKGVTTVNCSVTDASGNSASCSFTVTVRDTQAPTIGACPANISVVSSGGCENVTYTSPTATDNCGSATVVCSPASGFCFPAGTTTVTCTASDSSPDSPDSSCSFTVTVVPCTISCPGNISVGTNPSQQCGTTVSFSPTTSAGCGTVACSPSSGSFFPVGTTPVTCSTQAGPSCSFSVTVFDNTPPSLTCAPDQTALAGTGCQAQVPNFVVSAGDNCGGVTVTQTPAAGTVVGPGVYPVHVSVTDSSGNTTTCDKTFTVTNDPPIATNVTGPSGPIAEGSSASVTVTYTDTAVQGHSAEFSWDDGSPNTTVAAASPASSGSITASHTYATTGVYTVTVTVRDDCGAASAPFIYQFIVVYNPDGGFVTGGGWITSQPGSYVADPTATGKANFGFVSKYQHGATVPTGDTEFQFKAGNLNFKSTSYEWLVISGAKAQFKGSGKINGAGNYRFLLTATDGDRPGGGGTDKFRIKIWDAVTNVVVYDNKLGNSDDIDAANPQ
ncbi:MAG: HYR domain-containing protein, partial [Blastocatellia bacterium]